jgi:hypothetical protein
MQDSVTRAGCKAHQSSISWFVSSRRLIPLQHQSAVARGRQRRPRVGARRTPSTGTSTAACSRYGANLAGFAIILLAGLLLMGGPTAAAQAAPIQRQQVSERYATHVAEAAQRFGIPVDWIRAVMRIESGGDRRAVSPKGALGLMQLMPKTWTEMRVRYGLGHDPFDPHDNIFAGAAFLRELHDRYGSPGFLAAYNAGPGRYEDYRDRHRPLPTETVAYVAAIFPFVDVESTPGPLLVAAFSRSSWTRAPLFFTRVDGLSSATQATSDRPTTDKPAAVPVHDLSAIAPQSNGLFVALSTTGGSR